MSARSPATAASPSTSSSISTRWSSRRQSERGSMRFSFGGGIADWTFAHGDEVVIGAFTGNNAVVVGGVAITFWSDEQAGTQYDDLLDTDGQPITVVLSEDGAGFRSKGQIAPFRGPDGITKMWAQAGDNGPRALMVTTDAADTTNDPGTVWPPLSIAGLLSVGTGRHRLYNDTESNLTLASARATLGTPGSVDTVLDINRNGSSIFPAQTGRLTIAAGQNTSGKMAPLEVVQLNPGDYITVDVDQTGGGAGDLVVQLLMMQG
ncbi:hypothetical protein [Micromonospora sp. NPDC047730]|uniref:hypothetical protein n=1 Tax=Micromonospora sp. NPDC047730 TaxID=3364253 RepID=UPI0037105D11